MSTAYAEIQPPIFQQSVADMSVAHLSPDECQTVEIPCKLCGAPVAVQVPYDLDLAGVSIDRLAPTVVHDRCHDRAVAAEQARQLNARLDAAQADFLRLCPPEFRAPLDFSKNGCSRSLQERVMAHSFDNGRGLILRGPTKKCKTRFAWQLVRREIEQRRLKVVAMTHPEFRREAAAFATEAGRQALWFVTQCAKCDLFFLDDLGKGRITDAGEEVLEDIIDCRTRNHRPLLFTTNDTNESLRARLSANRADALLRRIWEFCDVIEF